MVLLDLLKEERGVKRMRTIMRRRIRMSLTFLCVE